VIAFVVAAILSVGYVLFNIVPQVAPIAQGCKVGKSVVCLIMVNMCHCKRNYAAGNRVRLPVGCTAPLTLIACPCKAYQLAYKPPLWMIFFVIYWHGIVLIVFFNRAIFFAIGMKINCPKYPAIIINIALSF
jgi:hypothetical protein